VRAVLAALLLSLCLTAVAQAKTTGPLIGIGEQHPQLFSDEAFAPLGIKDVRFIASYDALNSDAERAELDAYLLDARDAHVRVLLGFGHSRDPLRAHTAPSVKAFEREVVRFRHRYPWIHDYLTWNEANHCSQPICNNPKRAAQYYLVLRKHCSGCRIVAADMLDGAKLTQWAKAFQKAVGHRRVLWGLHNYVDANRFRERGTKALLRAVKGDVWFTETGGIVKRTNNTGLKLPQSTRHAAEATSYVFKLAALSKRVKRVYFYHWAPATTPNPTWDSALVDKHDRPRPAYEVLYEWLRKHGVAR
jgi:hypothetical protein